MVDLDSILAAQKQKNLGELLDLLELDLSRVGQNSALQAQMMLIRMDIVAEKIQSVAEAHLSTTAETSQFEYIQSSLYKNVKAFLNDIGGKEKYIQFRVDTKTKANDRWWLLDQVAEQQFKKRLQSGFKWIGSLAAIVLILVIANNTFLKPDPILLDRYNHQFDAEQRIAKNDYSGALSEINQALALGDDASLYLMRGAIEFHLGLKAESSEDFGTAEKILADHNAFLLARSETWLRVGQIEFAMQDASNVIQNDPDSAQGYYYYGKGLELQNHYFEAINAYQKASELAEHQGKAELNATIRMSMAMLMQSPPSQSEPTITATP